MDRVATRSHLGSKLVAALALVAGALALVVPASASADDNTFNCDALALRAQLLAIQPIVLGTANAGATECKDVDGTVISIPATAGLPINGGVLVAKTGVTPDKRAASSVAAITGLGVGLGGTALGQSLSAISQSLTGSQSPIVLSTPAVQTLLTGLGLAGSTPTITQGDLGTALNQILGSVLSNVLNGSIAGVGVAGAAASATCVNNAPVLKGTSQITGLTVLGQNIPLDPTVGQALTLLNTGQLQNLNLKAVVDQLVANLETALGVPTSSTDPTIIGLVNQLVAQLTSLVDTTVQPVLTQLLTAVQPLINGLIQITVEPNKQTIANGQLTQTALHLNITLLSQPLLDLVVGRARVSDTSVSCATPPPPVCTTRKLVLLDVFQQGNHAFFAGAAADKKFIGKTVPIYYQPTGKVVARAKVGADGLFQATGPLPPIGVRYTNKARYFARSLGETSLRLKFFRRMHVTTLTSSGGKVHISGTLAPPLTSPASRIVIQRRISCTKTVNVMTIAGTASGRFSATLAAPPSGQVGVYRATSFVRQNTRSHKPFATFTLPRYVDIS
ncbi:MAG: hypothetical protein QOE44_607 [Solirubrobacteraceae bacterium]|jgi:hypothetical protein|nr:hypothetical protein [Solirubrobacteraceae bacterium]